MVISSCRFQTFLTVFQTSKSKKDADDEPQVQVTHIPVNAVPLLYPGTMVLRGAYLTVHSDEVSGDKAAKEDGDSSKGKKKGETPWHMCETVLTSTQTGRRMMMSLWTMKLGAFMLDPICCSSSISADPSSLRGRSLSSSRRLLSSCHAAPLSRE